MMFQVFLKRFEEELQAMNEEEALMLFEKVKGHLVSLQKKKLADLEREQPPIMEGTRYIPRKRAAPTHGGYYAKVAANENNEKSLFLWSKWTQGRPPKVFSGLSAKELAACRISKEDFVKNADKETVEGFPVVLIHSNLGYDGQGRSIENFLLHNRHSDPEFAKAREEREQLRTPLSLRDKLAEKQRELEKQKGVEEVSPLTMEGFLEHLERESELDDD